MPAALQPRTTALKNKKELGLFTEHGRILEYVSNSEALAVAALLYECGEDLVWALTMAMTLLFCWEEWSTRDPTCPQRGAHIIHRTTASIVAKALGGLQPAEVLSLDGRRLNDRAVLWLCEALVIRKDIPIVDLSFNALSPVSMQHVRDCFRSTTMGALYLGNNKLGDTGAQVVASLLEENPYIQRLNLSNNGLTAVGATKIIEAIAHRYNALRRRRAAPAAVSSPSSPTTTPSPSSALPTATAGTTGDQHGQGDHEDPCEDDVDDEAVEGGVEKGNRGFVRSVSFTNNTEITMEGITSICEILRSHGVPARVSLPAIPRPSPPPPPPRTRMTGGEGKGDTDDDDEEEEGNHCIDPVNPSHDICIHCAPPMVIGPTDGLSTGTSSIGVKEGEGEEDVAVVSLDFRGCCQLSVNPEQKRTQSSWAPLHHGE